LFFLWRPPSNFFPHILNGTKEVDNGATPFASFLFAAVVLLNTQGPPLEFHLFPFNYQILVVDPCGFENRSQLETRASVVTKQEANKALNYCTSNSEHNFANF
jgi:hypothetical protein